METARLQVVHRLVHLVLAEEGPAGEVLDPPAQQIQTKRYAALPGYVGCAAGSDRARPNRAKLVGLIASVKAGTVIPASALLRAASASSKAVW